MDEVDVLGQIRLELGIRLADVELGAQDGTVDFLHDAAQVCLGAMLGQQDALPVPLVDVEAVYVVQLLVCADGVHVGDDAKAGLRLVLGQRQALPLRKGVHHLGHGIVHVLDGEADGALHAVEVVVDAQAPQHEERRRDATKPQLGTEAAQEKVFYLLYCLLCLAEVQQGFVPGRLQEFAHDYLRINALSFKIQCKGRAFISNCQQ